MKSQKQPKKVVKTPSQESVFTRDDFLAFLRKVSRPKKQGGKSSGAGKKRTSE